MKGKKTIPLWIGYILIGCSLMMMVLNRLSVYRQSVNAEAALDVISQLVTDTENAVLNARENNEMPSLSVDGIDYVGLIEIPKFNSRLPVMAEQNKNLPCPCVFDGSLYDGSLIIGASAKRGQLDFFKSIEVGDTVSFTDMTGKIYTYGVTDILYRDSLSEAISCNESGELKIFIKNPYGFEYVILICNEWR